MSPLTKAVMERCQVIYELELEGGKWQPDLCSPFTDIVPLSHVTVGFTLEQQEPETDTWHSYFDHSRVDLIWSNKILLAIIAALRLVVTRPTSRYGYLCFALIIKIYIKYFLKNAQPGQRLLESSSMSPQTLKQVTILFLLYPNYCAVLASWHCSLKARARRLRGETPKV